MNRPQLFFACILMFVLGKASAQSAKPSFKELTYISYHTDVIKGVTHIAIEDYLHINSTGTVRYIMNVYDGNAYLGKESDTTYKLNDTTVYTLNKVFNGKTSLKSHLATTTLGHAHYAGSYECIIYTDLAGKTDHLLFIASLLDPQLYRVVNDVIDHMPFAYSRSKAPYRNLQVESKLAEWYKTCNYMPKIEAPPTMMPPPPSVGDK